MGSSSGCLSLGFDVDLLGRVFKNLFGRLNVSLLNYVLPLLGCSFRLLMQSWLARVMCLLECNY